MFWPQAVTADPFTEDRKKVIDEDEQTTKNSNAIRATDWPAFRSLGLNS